MGNIMMPDLYVYNSGTQFIDATLSMDDLVLHRGTVIPPGYQAHISSPDDATHALVGALLQSVLGSVDRTTAPAPQPPPASVTAAVAAAAFGTVTHAAVKVAAIPVIEMPLPTVKTAAAASPTPAKSKGH